MRTAKVPMEAVKSKVMANLRERMDTQNHIVRPSFLTLMRAAGVCRQRIADAVKLLENEKKIEKIYLPRLKGKEGIDMFYKIID